MYRALERVVHAFLKSSYVHQDMVYTLLKVYKKRMHGHRDMDYGQRHILYTSKKTKIKREVGKRLSEKNENWITSPKPTKYSKRLSTKTTKTDVTTDS